jgi:hypothetical protein
MQKTCTYRKAGFSSIVKTFSASPICGAFLFITEDWRFTGKLLFKYIKLNPLKTAMLLVRSGITGLLF